MVRSLRSSERDRPAHPDPKGNAMALIISARNLQVGDTFAKLSGDVTRYTLTASPRLTGRTCGRVMPVGPVGQPNREAILLGPDVPVRVYNRGPVPMALRPYLSPRLSAHDESTPSTAWQPTAPGRNATFGTSIDWCHGVYRPERDQFATPCDGDQDWRP